MKAQMKKLRALCALSLLGALLLALPAAADAPVYARLVMPLFFEAKIPADIGLIAQEVNRIAQEKIGASVTVVPLLYLNSVADPTRLAELELLAKQGVRLDIYPSVVPNMEPLALDDLLARYGQDILALTGEFRMSFFTASGPLYRIQTMNDYVAAVGVTMRRDIVEKHGIDLTAIHSLRDLDALFSALCEKEPALRMVAPYQTRASIVDRYKHYQAVPFSILDVSREDATRIVNYYATDGYRETAEMLRKWYERGYLPEDLALQNIHAAELVNAGELFSYLCAYKPGIDFEESQSCGMDMVTVCLQAPIVTRRSLFKTHWCISAASVNPGKAMQFLNLLYTDSELVNLLMYGIEGLHYALLADGTIDYPEGVTHGTVGYQNTLSWQLPNQTIAHVWHGNDPGLWAELKAFNESAPVSGTLYFAFDASNVAAENTKVNAIASKYAYGLETGQLDPDVYLPVMLAEMEAAGAEAVVAEAQAQFDAFLAQKDVSK